jgi:hypothetical protein
MTHRRDCEEPVVPSSDAPTTMESLNGSISFLAAARAHQGDRSIGAVLAPLVTNDQTSNALPRHVTQGISDRLGLGRSVF